MGGVEIDLRVDVVPWGSRRTDEPNVLRREAVWQATVQMGQMTTLSFREPFYIYDSDIPLYEEIPGPDAALLQSARTLQFSTR
jgi:hypothetical protein